MCVYVCVCSKNILLHIHTDIHICIDVYQKIRNNVYIVRPDR